MTGFCGLHILTARNRIPDQYERRRLAVDESGGSWLTGMTSFPDLPARNAFQKSCEGGDFDGFLGLFVERFETLLRTYIGGNAHDILEGIALGKGEVYASGLSLSKGLSQKSS